MIQAARDKDQPDIPDDFGNRDYSPYRFFTADEWAHFRADTPLTLTGDEVQRLRSLNDPIEPEEPPRLLDIKTLTSEEWLNTTERQVRRLIADKKIPYVKVGHFVRFDPAEIRKWIDSSRVDVAR